MKPSQILFITSNSIGDAVLSTAILTYLHHLFPKAEFTVVCGENPAPIFQAPFVRRVLPVRKRKRGGHWWEIWLACLPTRWSLVVDMRSSALGFFLMTRRRRIWRALPDSLSKKQQFEVFLRRSFPGFSPGDLPLPRVYPSPKSYAAAAPFLRDYPGAVVLGATANARFKCWETEKYAQLASYIHTKVYPDSPVVALGGATDKPSLDALAKASHGLVVPLAGCLDIGATAAFLASAKLFVGNDSGLMHLSAAVGIPTLGLFGPSPDTIYHPLGACCHWVRTDRSYAELLADIFADRRNEATSMGTLSVEKVITALHELLTGDATLPSNIPTT